MCEGVQTTKCAGGGGGQDKSHKRRSSPYHHHHLTLLPALDLRYNFLFTNLSDGDFNF